MDEAELHDKLAEQLMGIAVMLKRLPIPYELNFQSELHSQVHKARLRVRDLPLDEELAGVINALMLCWHTAGFLLTLMATKAVPEHLNPWIHDATELLLLQCDVGLQFAITELDISGT